MAQGARSSPSTTDALLSYHLDLQLSFHCFHHRVYSAHFTILTLKVYNAQVVIVTFGYAQHAPYHLLIGTVCDCFYTICTVHMSLVYTMTYNLPVAIFTLGLMCHFFRTIMIYTVYLSLVCTMIYNLHVAVFTLGHTYTPHTTSAR